MPNDSSTGGYLAQISGPVDGVNFRRFIGDFIAGISGYPKDNVRPNWQQNPPPMPEIDVNWISFGITQRRAEFSGYQRENDLGTLTELIRHE